MFFSGIVAELKKELLLYRLCYYRDSTSLEQNSFMAESCSATQLSLVFDLNISLLTM
jgi:hypothetical protein